MLLRFGFANHRSFATPAEISFVAARGSDHPTHPRPVPKLRHGALPLVGLYGANASGKSGALGALSFMASQVVNSFVRQTPTGPIPRHPFKLDAASLAAPSRFDCDFVLGGVRYHYGFACTSEAFEEEWLYAWPAGIRQVWFHRIGQDKAEWYFGPGLKPNRRVAVAETRPNSLYVSAAAQLGHEQMLDIYRFFSERLHISELEPTRLTTWYSSPLFDPERRPQILALMNAADLGVVDLRTVVRRTWIDDNVHKLDEDVQVQLRRLQAQGEPRQVLLGHRGPSGAVAWLEPEEESQGTLAFLSHLHVLLSALDRGALLAVDELDRSLHPLLVARVLDLFSNPSTNPNGAQLLFTTHDTNLLAHLRRDEVVLAEKSLEGGSSLTPLASYRALKREDLATFYQQGRYGGVPRLGSFARAFAVEPSARTDAK